jgi:hypothetical protein
MARSLDSDRFRVWRQRLARFETAGLSVARFCQQEGVSTAAFYQWRKKLATVAPPTVPGDQAAFANVRLVTADDMRVELRGGTQLHIPCGDSHTLQLALQTLAEADARLAKGGDAC